MLCSLFHAIRLIVRRSCPPRPLAGSRPARPLARGGAFAAFTPPIVHFIRTFKLYNGERKNANKNGGTQFGNDVLGKPSFFLASQRLEIFGANPKMPINTRVLTASPYSLLYRAAGGVQITSKQLKTLRADFLGRAKTAFPRVFEGLAGGLAWVNGWLTGPGRVNEGRSMYSLDNIKPQITSTFYKMRIA